MGRGAGPQVPPAPKAGHREATRTPWAPGAAKGPPWPDRGVRPPLPSPSRTPDFDTRGPGGEPSWVRALPVLLLTLFSGACAELRSPDEAPLGLAPGEQAQVRSKVDQALEGAGRVDWTAAWNQEVQAGADPERLSRIALGALRADATDAADMYAALVRKWGPLAGPHRAEVTALVQSALGRGDWSRALEIELLTADDAPTYSRAWALYEQAPLAEGPGLLQEIHDARTRHEKESD